MNESDWNACDDPDQMLRFLRDSGKLSDRKARLFAVACCRRIWPLLLEEEACRSVIEVAERFAEGLASEVERREARKAVFGMIGNNQPLGSVARKAARASVKAQGAVAAEDAAHCSRSAASWSSREQTEGSDSFRMVWQAEEKAQAILLRDLFGPLPFRPLPPLDPAVFAWNSGTVVRLAEAAYQERELPSGHLDRARLAVLADALEEAGCQDQDILGHLRGPGPHVRGCWVVDILTGRK